MLNKCLKTHKKIYIVKYRFTVITGELYPDQTTYQFHSDSDMLTYPVPILQMRKSICQRGRLPSIQTNALFCSTPNANSPVAESPSVCQIHFCFSWTCYVGTLCWVAVLLGEGWGTICHESFASGANERTPSGSLPEPGLTASKMAERRGQSWWIHLSSQETLFCCHRNCDAIIADLCRAIFSLRICC